MSGSATKVPSPTKKMQSSEMTSEDAWRDFKSGYSDFQEHHIGKDRDGDKASPDDKLTIISAKLQELQTDVDRLTDSIPQALGTIEESKTLEAEAEQEGSEEGEGGEDMFGGQDDGLDEFFADDEEGDGDMAEGEEGSEEEFTDGEGSEEGTDDDYTEEEGSDYTEEGTEEGSEEEFTDGEDNYEAEDEEGSEEASEGSGDDDDFIPIDEVNDGEEEEGSEDGSEETSEEDDEEKKTEEEVMEKMVKALSIMDKRITHLEHENAGLKKSLSELTVKNAGQPMAKQQSRQTAPQQSYKIVKGSVNRPPVSTQYVANQRDIGIGKAKDVEGSKSIFGGKLNDVFENCMSVARNGTN